MKQINIAIDGPASSGKSTVAKILAKNLHFIYTDTGAMYRALTYLAIKYQIPFNQGQELADLMEEHTISFKQTPTGQLVFADTQDVTEAIRQPEVTNAVSEVSAHGAVRDKLLKVQREIAKNGGVVMDGRDIGTTVLPEAEVKIFLVASVQERAERRYKENLEKNIPTDFEELKKEIQQRDYTDSHRKISPLVQAEDAVKVDTTGLSILEVVEKIDEIIAEKTK